MTDDSKQNYGIPDRISSERVENDRSSKTIGKKVYYLDETGSTNDVAIQLASSGSCEGTLVIAESQTRGRGRMGRTWISTKHENLLFSVILRPSLKADFASQLTMLGALAVADSMNECGLKATIKWPNDVYVNECKISGILTDIKSEQNQIQYAVLGIGINVNMLIHDFPAELRGQMTSMANELGKKVDRHTVLCRVLDQIEKNYQLVKTGLYEKIQERWSALSLLTGRWVSIQRGSRLFEGIVVGTDLRGDLILRFENGCLESFQSGDVRLQYDG